MATLIYHLNRRKGFSLLELVVFLSIFVIASALAIRLLSRSFSPLQHLAQGADDQTTLQRAMANLISDIKEADPSSLPWDKLPASELSFQKAHYDTVSGSYLTPTAVHYYYVLSTGTDTGSLIRSQDATDRTILDYVEPPTTAEPIFQKDPTLPILIVTLRYHPPGRSSIRAVRRVGTQG